MEAQPVAQGAPRYTEGSEQNEQNENDPSAPDILRQMMGIILDEWPFWMKHIVQKSADEAQLSVNDTTATILQLSPPFDGIAWDLKEGGFDSEVQEMAKTLQQYLEWLVQASKNPDQHGLGGELQVLMHDYSTAPVGVLRKHLAGVARQLADEVVAKGVKSISYDDVLLQAMERLLDSEQERSLDNQFWEDVARALNDQTGSNAFRSSSCEKRYKKLGTFKDDSSQTGKRLTRRQRQRYENVKVLAERQSSAVETDTHSSGDEKESPCVPGSTNDHPRVSGQRRLRSEEERRERDDVIPFRSGSVEDLPLPKRLCADSVASFSGDQINAANIDVVLLATMPKDREEVAESAPRDELTWKKIYDSVAPASDSVTQTMEKPLKEVCKALTDALKREYDCGGDANGKRADAESEIKEVLDTAQYSLPTRVILTLGQEYLKAPVIDDDVRKLELKLRDSQGPVEDATEVAAKEAIDLILAALSACIERQRAIASVMDGINLGQYQARVDELTTKINKRVAKADLDRGTARNECEAAARQFEECGEELVAVVKSSESVLGHVELLEKHEALRSTHETVRCDSTRMEAWFKFNQKVSDFYEVVLPAVEAWLIESAKHVNEEKQKAEEAIADQLEMLVSKIAQATRPFFNFHSERVKEAEKELAELDAMEDRLQKKRILVTTKKRDIGEKRMEQEAIKEESMGARNAVISAYETRWTEIVQVFPQSVLDRIAHVCASSAGTSTDEVESMMRQWAHVICPGIHAARAARAVACPSIQKPTRIPRSDQAQGPFSTDVATPELEPEPSQQLSATASTPLEEKRKGSGCAVM